MVLLTSIKEKISSLVSFCAPWWYMGEEGRGEEDEGKTFLSLRVHLEMKMSSVWLQIRLFIMCSLDENVSYKKIKFYTQQRGGRKEGIQKKWRGKNRQRWTQATKGSNRWWIYTRMTKGVWGRRGKGTKKVTVPSSTKLCQARCLLDALLRRQSSY